MKNYHGRSLVQRGRSLVAQDAGRTLVQRGRSLVQGDRDTAGAGWQEPGAGWQEPGAGWQEPGAGWQGAGAGWQDVECNSNWLVHNEEEMYLHAKQLPSYKQRGKTCIWRRAGAGYTVAGRQSKKPVVIKVRGRKIKGLQKCWQEVLSPRLRKMPG